MIKEKRIILIFVIIFLILASFFYFKLFKENLPKKNTKEISPTFTPFPTWIPKPNLIRPTITYENFPFKSTDKTRKVEIIGCVVDNSEWGMSYPKKIVEIPNTPAVASETIKSFLKEAAESGWGGFPTKNEIERYFGRPGEVSLKKLTIDKYGTARVYFSKEIKAYGGGSGRVSCMHDSIELTLKQFSSIKNIVMCIEDICADQKGAEIFQP